jgi:mono/diheme cytochrome c family protein
MARLACALCVVAGLAAVAPTAASAQQTSEAMLTGVDGGSLFRSYCGSCHGKQAKGDGALAESLRVRPPDLTLIAKHNKGTFDADKVYRIIDGREPVKGHGDSDMPVWGDAFKRTGDNSEKMVKARIDAIVAHLKSLQAK